MKNIIFNFHTACRPSPLLSLSEIGKLFKMDYSAVSQAAKRFEQKYEVNHEIKEVMQKVITVLKEV